MNLGSTTESEMLMRRQSSTDSNASASSDGSLASKYFGKSSPLGQSILNSINEGEDFSERLLSLANKVKSNLSEQQYQNICKLAQEAKDDPEKAQGLDQNIMNHLAVLEKKVAAKKT